MTETIFASTLLVLVASLLVFIDYRRNRAIDSPGVLAGVLWLMMNTPTLFSIATDGNYFDNIRWELRHLSIVEMYESYVWVQLVYFLMLYAGIWSVFKRGEHNTFEDLAEKIPAKELKAMLFVCLFFFCLGVFVLWTKNGGLLGILARFGNRSDMNNESIFIQIGYATPYTLLTCMLLLYLKGERKRWHFWGMLVVILFQVLALMLTGGRKPYMLIFYYLMFYSIMGQKRLEIRKYLKYVFLLPIIFILFTTTRVLRDWENNKEFMKTGQLRREQFESKAGEAKDDMSYINTYTGIVNYFHEENYYYGASFIDLLYAYVPRKWIRSKPPVDDGMYISTIFILGKYVKHPADMRELAWTAWPPETLGNGYANFGLVGVVLFAFLLGAIYSWVYNALQTSSRHKLFLTILYPYVLFAFHISNLRIVALISMTVVFYALFYGCRMWYGLIGSRRI